MGKQLGRDDRARLRSLRQVVEVLQVPCRDELLGSGGHEDLWCGTELLFEAKRALKLAGLTIIDKIV